jgi:hypothetical protein
LSPRATQTKKKARTEYVGKHISKIKNFQKKSNADECDLDNDSCDEISSVYTKSTVANKHLKNNFSRVFRMPVSLDITIFRTKIQERIKVQMII